MRFVTSPVRLRIQRTCLHLPTSPKTSSPVTTTATSSLLLMWLVLSLLLVKHHTHCYITSHPLHLFAFAVSPQNLAYEIILTLGQAFEVAYQLALQARKSGHGSSTLPESFDSKPGKPVPKPRVNIRKSVSSPATQPQHGLKGKSILNWNPTLETPDVFDGLDLTLIYLVLFVLSSGMDFHFLITF